MGPVPDPLTVAPIDLDSPNATAINRNMSAFIDVPLHADPNAYLRDMPQGPHATYVEYNLSRTGTPMQNGAVALHRAISPIHHLPLHPAMAPVYHRVAADAPWAWAGTSSSRVAASFGFITSRPVADV